MKLALLGHPLGHSFSEAYFKERFARLGLDDCSYENIDSDSLENTVSSIRLSGELDGFNVTLPYKRAIIPFLDELSAEARAIGAVNVVKVVRRQDGSSWWVGYNTDFIGFRDSLLGFLGGAKPARALVLGDGGAAQAVQYALYRMGVPYLLVSRRKAERRAAAGFAPQNRFSYTELTPIQVAESQLIINTTILGMYPDTESCPDIPYAALTPAHKVFDLVYNPAETLFMRKCAAQGAAVRNGLEMLHLQADAARQIWGL